MSDDLLESTTHGGRQCDTPQRFKDTGDTAPGLPAVAAVELLADPLAVAMVRRGHSGYWLIHRASDAGTAAAIREAINNAAGVTLPQREAMAAGSMFGWSCPAADPASYTAAGHIRPEADDDNNVRNCAHEFGDNNGRSYCIHCGIDGDG